jgi:general secretion pathway protein M
MKNWLLLLSLSLRDRLRLLVRAKGITRHVAAGLAARLSPRERWFAAAAGVVLAGTVLILFVIAPLVGMRGRLQTRVTTKERELTEVTTLASTYEQLRRELERVGPANASTLSPFAFLEGLTTSALGREKLAAINPIEHEERGGGTQETIELKLNGVSLQELVDLLYKIDVSGTAMRCATLAIKKRYRDPYTFDVTLTAIALNAR